uniref:Uncharacterized protein n=1 Tax=Arundo donax TaxID=35708 RepID=A0A0A8Z3B1_ARUDO
MTTYAHVGDGRGGVRLASLDDGSYNLRRLSSFGCSIVNHVWP